MIKAIILDVDGVIIGETVDYNSPNPHPDVLQALKTIRSRNIPVILCTARPSYTIRTMIEEAKLYNPHITDAGAVIIDPLNDEVIKTYVINNALAAEVLKICLENDIYTEFYTLDDYFIQKSQRSDITRKHTYIQQKAPKAVESLVNASFDQKIVKIIPIAENEEDKKRVVILLQRFSKQLSMSWGIYPIALPLQFGIITALGSSKKDGAIRVAHALHIPFNTILGIGDSPSDWQFMSLCGYAATLSNASRELKDLVRSKGAGKYYVGPSVDANGVLEIFDYFLDEEFEYA